MVSEWTDTSNGYRERRADLTRWLPLEGIDSFLKAEGSQKTPRCDYGAPANGKRWKISPMDGRIATVIGDIADYLQEQEETER